MKRLVNIFTFLFVAASAFATTTVTGTMQNLGTGNVTPNAFMRFWLRGCGGNQPRVTGTALIAPSQGGVYFFDFAANASGQISGTLYSTRDSTGLLAGDIDCGGSKTAVWYGMVAYYNGKAGPEIPVHAKSGVTLDITQVSPITTNPVVTSPTGDSTYARLDGGNQPFTGNVTPNGNGTLNLGSTSNRWNLNAAQINANGTETHSGTVTNSGTTNLKTQQGGQIVYADQFSGATFDAKINAAISALGSLRGTVDARGLVAGCTPSTACGTIAATITIPAQVTLIWPNSSGWVTCNTGSSTAPCILMNASSSLVCYAIGANFCNIKMTSGGSAQAIVQTGNQNVAIENIYISGIQLTQDVTATVGNALLDIISTYDSVFDKVTATNTYSNASNTNKSVWIHDFNGTVGDNALDFFQLFMQGSLWITSNNGAAVNAIRFYGGDIQHRIGTSNGVPGNNVIHIDGLNHQAGVYDISFFGTYSEQGASDLDQTTAQVSIKDAGKISFIAGDYNISNSFAPGASNGLITVAQSGAGSCSSGAQCTYGIFFQNYLIAGLNGAQNAIYNAPNTAYSILGQGTLNWLYQNAGSLDPSPELIGYLKALNFNVGSGSTVTSTGAGGTMAAVIASGTAAMTTGAITSGTCGSTVQVAAANVATTDAISWAFNAAPAANPAQLVVSAWPTSGNVNFQYCNPTAGSITPNAATLNWRVVR